MLVRRLQPPRHILQALEETIGAQILRLEALEEAGEGWVGDTVTGLNGLDGVVLRMDRRRRSRLLCGGRS